MDWREYSAARQYVSEHRIGTRLREKSHAEEAQAKRSRQALR